jgi:hypothetical protein
MCTRQILVGPYGPFVQKRISGVNGSDGTARNNGGGDDKDNKGGDSADQGAPSGAPTYITAKLPAVLCSNLEQLTLETIDMCAPT